MKLNRLASRARFSSVLSTALCFMYSSPKSCTSSGNGGRSMDDTIWFPLETAPTDGTPFYGKLTIGPVRMLWATRQIRRYVETQWHGARYSYWGSGALNEPDRVPYEPSFPEGFIPPDRPRLIGWQPIHV